MIYMLAMGLLFCKEPKEPYCLSSLFLNSADEIHRCRYDVEMYQDDVKKYVDCISEERQRVIKQHNDIVQKWNRRATGR